MSHKLSQHKITWMIFCLFFLVITGYMIYKDLENPPHYLSSKEKQVSDVISCEKSNEFLLFMGYKDKKECDNLMNHLFSQAIDVCENQIDNRSFLTETQRKDILLDCVYHYLSYSVGTENSINTIDFTN